jgi:adenine-specific DNA-methyltransferase
VVAVQQTWDPYSSAAWAQALGLVHVPMFAAPPKDPRWAKGEHAVLLDGERGSFAFNLTDEVLLAQEIAPLAWAWSSHVGHALIAVKKPGLLYVRRWDVPSLVQPLILPQTQEEADKILAAIEQAFPARKADAVQFVLNTFRQIRSLHECSEPLWAIRLLNAVLLASDLARSGKSQMARVCRAAKFGELVACLTHSNRALAEVEELPSGIANQDIGPLVVNLLSDVHYPGLKLLPSLLLRHASSRLYQEAHLQIERSAQMNFPGMAPEDEPRGRLQRDVRFTPTNLARTLVQQAILALGKVPSNVSVLDPACGSGVFLQEFLKEMALRGGSSKPSIFGYDISNISACMARFCLNTAASDLSRVSTRAQVSIQQRDSLQDRAWTEADIILMNPPFIPWSGLTPAQQSLVRETLGQMSSGRPDIAMAFVWNAIESLKPGGVLACVLPAALLSSTSGKAWRDRIQGEGEIVVLGRFEGYRYFSTSLVETSFLVFRRKLDSQPDSRTAGRSIQMLVAREGCEDASLRALRLQVTDARRTTDGVQVFSVAPESLLVNNWRPQREETYAQLSFLRSQHRALPDLFEIRQGIRVGDKHAFLLSLDEYNKLPEEEHVYFRPAVGSDTLQDGRLLKREFIFYPYGETGLQIASEEDLRRLVPEYFKKWLLPRKNALQNRPRIQNWWALAEYRAWQTGRVRHIVSTYFGKRGSFAYNSTGDYVVVNGHAWTWKRDQRQYEERQLPWAYLALLNSEAFERLLSWISVPLQGGQFRLEKRYLAKVPLPDLGEDTLYSDAVVEELAALGKAIGKGQLSSVCDKVDKLASSLLGIVG